MNGESGEGYREAWRRSISSPEDFWLEAAEGIDWITQPTRALAVNGKATGSWFPGGMLNTSYNALDRHVLAGRGAHTALIYDSAMTGTRVQLSYLELLGRVARFAGVLRANGVGTGDRVIIYLPMIPEAVVAMLACARIGAVHSVVFGGFAATELAVRIDDARPSVIVTASGGLEPGRAVEYLPLVEKALALSQGSVHTVIVRNRDSIPGSAVDYQKADAVWLDWADEEATAAPADPVALRSDDPLYILYTSGTTGKPKGIIRDNGGHAVSLNWSMRNVYNVGPGDVYWAASDVGWVVGHSYIVYAPLLAGATTVIYEGMNLVIFPVSLLRLAMGSAARGLDAIEKTGSLTTMLPEMQHRAELYELLDYASYSQFDSGIFDFTLNPHISTPSSTQA